MKTEKVLEQTEQSSSDVESIIDNKFRASVGRNIEELISFPKLILSHSLNNLRIGTPRVSDLEHQNELLKAEISSLKQQLKIEKASRKSQVQQLQRQISKLKTLIQKSYYSLKGIQNQNISIQKQLVIRKSLFEKQKKHSHHLQQKVIEMDSYIQFLRNNHKIETDLIWERVAHLQKNLESIVKLFEEERKFNKKIGNLKIQNYQYQSGRNF